jgi:hypothetical protein
LGGRAWTAATIAMAGEGWLRIMGPLGPHTQLY